MSIPKDVIGQSRTTASLANRMFHIGGDFKFTHLILEGFVDDGKPKIEDNKPKITDYELGLTESELLRLIVDSIAITKDRVGMFEDVPEKAEEEQVTSHTIAFTGLSKAIQMMYLSGALSAQTLIGRGELSFNSAKVSYGLNPTDQIPKPNDQQTEVIGRIVQNLKKAAEEQKNAA